MDMETLITNLLTPQGFGSFIKIGLTAIMVLYTLYSFIVLRQVDLMIKSFTTTSAVLFKTLAWMHLGISILISFLAIITL